MSHEDVEVVRRTIEAFNGDGLDAALEYLDPEVEWLAPPEWLEERLFYFSWEEALEAGGQSDQEMSGAS